MILSAVAVAGWQGGLEAMTKQALEAGRDAVMLLALPLAGAMAVWLGMMRLAEKAGLVRLLAVLLRPVLTRLFPDLPRDHPAMGAMVMNMAANMLGLGNAATPLGLKAMQELERLNPRQGTATNAMCTFLAINTSSVQLMPFTAVAILVAGQAAVPTAIVGSAMLATTVSTIVGITAVKLLERLPVYRLPPIEQAPHSTASKDETLVAEPTPPAEALQGVERKGWPTWLTPLALATLAVGFALLFLRTGRPEWFGFEPIGAGSETPAPNAFVRWLTALSVVAVPFLLCGLPLFAAAKGVPVYEEFVEGAKEGFHVAVRIIPFLVAMLVAIGMFRGAGCIDWLTDALREPLTAIGFPPEVLPMALMRPLSGSGTMGIFQDLVATHGPDSVIARMAGTIFGSTETTFYVVALYFGSVGVKRSRHAIPAGLLADAAGIAAAVIVCRAMFGFA